MASLQAWKSRLGIALVLGAAVTQVYAADAVVSFAASSNPATVGSPVGLDIAISGVQDLYAYQFTLSFNAAVLQVMDVTEGAFLGTGGTTYADNGTIDNTLGSVSFIFNTLLGVTSGVNGGGVLSHINFNVIGAGSSPLGLSDVVFLNSQSGDVPVTVQASVLQAAAVPEPASYLLFAAGFAGLAALRRRQAA